MRTLSVAAAVVMIVAAVSAQEKRANDARVMTVTGCVEKSCLKVLSVDPVETHLDKFRLKGNKDLMKTLTKDLNGHEVEVTGVLEDPQKVMGTGQSKEIGKKTRIYVGQRERSEIPPTVDPAIVVDTFKDIKPRCR